MYLAQQLNLVIQIKIEEELFFYFVEEYFLVFAKRKVGDLRVKFRNLFHFRKFLRHKEKNL